MNNFDEVNRTRYAQMQSSIFNKTGSSIVAGSSSTLGSGSKLNLTGKFSVLEEAVAFLDS
jgi:hypothetical protein